MLHLVVISSQYSLVCDKFLYLSLFSWPWQFWRILVQHFEKHPSFYIWYETPVQARWTTLDAWGWCTGTTQRDGMGREEGGGPSTGNMCTPAADPCWHMTKPIQHCKAKKKQNKQTKKKHPSYFFHGQNHHGVMIFVMNHRCDVSFSSHQGTCDINVMT